MIDKSAFTVVTRRGSGNITPQKGRFLRLGVKTVYFSKELTRELLDGGALVTPTVDPRIEKLRSRYMGINISYDGENKAIMVAPDARDGFRVRLERSGTAYLLSPPVAFRRLGFRGRFTPYAEDKDIFVPEQEFEDPFEDPKGLQEEKPASEDWDELVTLNESLPIEEGDLVAYVYNRNLRGEKGFKSGVILGEVQEVEERIRHGRSVRTARVRPLSSQYLVGTDEEDNRIRRQTILPVNIESITLIRKKENK